MPTIPGIENVNFTAYVASAAGYVVWGLFIVLILVAGFLVFHFMSFKIKAIVVPIVGSGVEGGYSAGKSTTNRFKWNKKKTAWIAMKPFFNNREFEPFDNQYIYAGNKVFAFKLPDGRFVAGSVNISSSESENLVANINPIPKYIRRFEEVEMIADENEFSTQTTWDKYGQFVTVLAVSLICLVMVVATVYFTYKFTSGGVAASDRFVSAVEKMSSLGSVNR